MTESVPCCSCLPPLPFCYSGLLAYQVLSAILISYRFGQCNRKAEILEDTVVKAMLTNFTVPSVFALLTGAIMGCVCPQSKLFVVFKSDSL